MGSVEAAVGLTLPSWLCEREQLFDVRPFLLLTFILDLKTAFPVSGMSDFVKFELTVEI